MQDFFDDLIADWRYHLPSLGGAIAGLVFLLSVPAALWLWWSWDHTPAKPLWMRAALALLALAIALSWAIGMMDAAERRRVRQRRAQERRAVRAGAPRAQPAQPARVRPARAPRPRHLTPSTGVPA